MARVVFLGTPEAAVPTLQAVAAEHEVVLVITQPDRPKGRSGKPSPTPVKSAAAELGLETAQPTTRSELFEALEDADPFDLGVIVAYGRILRPEVLQLPAHGLLNVHFSLLPRWRGAAPVARALMAGDAMTGVTIIKLDEGLDTGPVLTAQAVDIASDENAGSLTTRIAGMGARLLATSIEPYLTGEIVPTPQTDEGATYAEKIEPSDRPVRPSLPVDTVINQVRALAPSPTATLKIDDVPHKIYEVGPTDIATSPGTWHVANGLPVIGISDGSLEVLVVQPPGKNPMSGADWARGLHTTRGKIS